MTSRRSFVDVQIANVTSCPCEPARWKLRYATTAPQGVATLVDAPCLKASFAPSLSFHLARVRKRERTSGERKRGRTLRRRQRKTRLRKRYRDIGGCPPVASGLPGPSRRLTGDATSTTLSRFAKYQYGAFWRLPSTGVPRNNAGFNEIVTTCTFASS